MFVLNAVDGCIPSDLAVKSSAEIEEERRLLYVAMTRAKDDLHFIIPQRFFTYGQRAAPDDLLSRFESTSWREARPAPAQSPARGAGVDVRARLRGMWKN